MKDVCGVGGAALAITKEYADGSVMEEERDLTCALPVGHDGLHEDASGWVEWGDEE